MAKTTNRDWYNFFQKFLNENQFNGSDIIKQIIENKNINTKEYVKDIKLLSTPEITEATYHHKTVYYGDTNRLQVRWNAVDDATSYEIVVTKSDGTSRTYTSNYTSLIVKKGSDDFITECTNQNGKSAKVKVRAVKNDGEVYSLWTDDETVSCNSIHFN